MAHYEIKDIKARYNIYQTVDTSGTESDKADYFVVLTFAMVTKTIDGETLITEHDYIRAQKNNLELIKHIYILDVFRKRFDTTEHQSVMKLQRELWSPTIQYVEATVFGLNIIQDAEKRGLPIKPLQADKSKFLRSEQISVYYKNGQVWHPKEAPWLKEFEDEISGFPVAPHDDQFDCVSYAGIVAAKKQV